ncbi:Mediator of plasmid stability, partial [Klebsiella pneumoniae]
SVSELQALVQQMAGTADVSRAAAAVPDTPATSDVPVSGADTREIKKNMRRAFGD